MLAMLFDGKSPTLRAVDLPKPTPRAGQVLIRVLACGVCRTDLHVVDGELQHPLRPVIPGHEIVGTVEELGPEVSGYTYGYARGERVGVPWLGHTCGHCRFCIGGRENLCDTPGFTGYTINGGYAEYTVAQARYCVSLPPSYSDEAAAPLLCAGLIGYRSLRMAQDAQRVGMYGFGAAAHLVAQVALAQGRQVFAFTRPGDDTAQQFARSLGVHWAGGSDEAAPVLLDAALLFAPVGALVPTALAALDKGGIAICGGIHMSDIPAFSYDLLWEERRICSVANLTRADATEFMALAAKTPLQTRTTPYPLERANDALDDLRSGRLSGAAVLIPGMAA
jgi:propanol-preferring alcohol dehydrogenase